jgi:hypothetical protein
MYNDDSTIVRNAVESRRRKAQLDTACMRGDHPIHGGKARRLGGARVADVGEKGSHNGRVLGDKMPR